MHGYLLQHVLYAPTHNLSVSLWHSHASSLSHSRSLSLILSRREGDKRSVDGPNGGSGRHAPSPCPRLSLYVFFCLRRASKRRGGPTKGRSLFVFSEKHAHSHAQRQTQSQTQSQTHTTHETPHTAHPTHNTAKQKTTHKEKTQWVRKAPQSYIYIYTHLYDHPAGDKEVGGG